MSYVYAGTYGPQPILDVSGNPLASFPISVYEPGTTTPVVLYTDRTMAATTVNPTTTDDVGNLTFFCAPGEVTVAGDDASFNALIPPDPADLTTVISTVTQEATNNVLDPTVAPEYDLTMTGNTTFTFANMGLGSELSLTLRGQYQVVWPVTPAIAWRPFTPTYADTGNGMSFEFWVTQSGEIRGAAL